MFHFLLPAAVPLFLFTSLQSLFCFLSVLPLNTSVTLTSVRAEFVPCQSHSWASLIAQSVKNLPAVRETRVQFLGQEDPLEKKMATHSNLPA